MLIYWRVNQLNPHKLRYEVPAAFIFDTQNISMYLEDHPTNHRTLAVFEKPAMSWVQQLCGMILCANYNLSIPIPMINGRNNPSSKCRWRVFFLGPSSLVSWKFRTTQIGPESLVFGELTRRPTGGEDSFKLQQCNPIWLVDLEPSLWLSMCWDGSSSQLTNSIIFQTGGSTTK